MESNTTIAEFLRSRLGNYELDDINIQIAAESPIEIGLEPFELDDSAMVYPKPIDFDKRRDYAESCVYYFALGVFSGGGESEKIGNESYSKTSLVITKNDRVRFKAMADSLREKHSLPILETDNSGFYDASKYMSIKR